jgi:hypothetical protein
METEIFNDLCYLLEAADISDSELINSSRRFGSIYLNLCLNRSNQELYESNIIPLSQELNENLEVSGNKKSDVIKTYLTRLNKINMFFKKSETAKLLFQNFNKPKSREYTFIINAHYLFVTAVNEIQSNCVKHNINFQSICNEVDFNCPPFLFGDSLLYNGNLTEKKKQSKSPHENNFHNEENRNNINPQDNLQNIPPPIEQKNDDIFCNNGFDFFEYLLDENYIRSKGVKGRYADISFFYRKMKVDKYIRAGIDEFRLWFIGKYTEEFSKILISDNPADIDRKKDYDKAKKDWINNQKP